MSNLKPAPFPLTPAVVRAIAQGMPDKRIKYVPFAHFKLVDGKRRDGGKA